MVESVDEIEWKESPEASFLEDLRERVGPPRVSRPPAGYPAKESVWYIAAEFIYGDGLFARIFEVGPEGGEVQMLDDNPLTEDLPVVKDIERLADIGIFDTNGTLSPSNPRQRMLIHGA